MRIVKRILSVLALCGSAFMAPGASASPASPVAGTDYVVLPTAQNTDTGKKIEVIEFFAYWCPHCNVLEPMIDAWVKKQGANIVFKRVHVPRGEPQQKLYFTLEALGLVDKYQTKVFRAIHVEREKLERDGQVFDWVAKNGIDRQKFIDTYRSFAVQSRATRAEKMMNDYKIDSWPMLIVDGRYQTSAYQVSQSLPADTTEVDLHAASLQVMDHLVAKAKAEKK
ncbi:thiol:disulfide interchange protein DsbA/DsbL [Pseudoduganella namucuonensis]|uniref:Thiol:disulfide interchange protein DsbA n=1 Tax=Pseudoduganella namucuonensis TaxID=1035707 RepID=A0A1I7ETH0_9BURK|nr:thiol:disulfide interchange protein DsbA/DsbL [Pseudoduganella namucuonensis]SFU27225.1 Thiol:disulfide interchange protein DsbA [Pseudoduganella namucuonensis]